MIVDTLLLRLGGESGTDNAVSAGDVLTLSMARSGYQVHTFRTYPAEIKGGPVMFQLRVGVHRLPSLGDQLDLLLAFNEEAWDLHHEALRPDGILTSVDVEAENQRVAKATFAAAGINPNRTRLITGRALEVLPRLTDGAYDIVFVDGDKSEYAAYLDQAVRLLRPGGAVVFDNALWHDKVADPAQLGMSIRIGRFVLEDHFAAGEHGAL